MQPTKLIDAPEELMAQVVDAAISVHRALGPGLLESIYEAAMMAELEHRKIPARSQVPVNVYYRGKELGIGYRADIIVDNCLILELKTAKEITDDHLAQIMTYIKVLGVKRGFILNFHAKLMKDGIKRVSI